MLPSLIRPMPVAPSKADRVARLRALFAAPGRIRVLRIAAHRTVMGAGVCAIGAMGMMFVKPELTEHLKAMSPFAPKTVQQASVTEKPVVQLATKALAASTVAATVVAQKPAQEEPAQPQASHAIQLDRVAKLPAAAELKDVAPREQKWVTNWLSKRYRVASDATNMLVSATYSTAKEVKIDPLLVLAVMAIESGFNPFAESPVGAQGLMQVMSKVHHDKFKPLGGVNAALNPAANIRVGATILKEYVSRGGSVESGLKMYVGAAAFENDAGYGYKVLAEYKRLKDVASGKIVPVTTTSNATVAAKLPVKPAPQPAADDKVDVLTQAAGNDLRQKNASEDGIVAAL